MPTTLLPDRGVGLGLAVLGRLSWAAAVPCLQTLLRGTGKQQSLQPAQSLADGEGCWLLGSCARTRFQAELGVFLPDGCSLFQG